MSRPTNTSERRTQIARAMMKVMARNGYDRTSMPEIAKAAALTQGLIHYHFKNKLEILLAAIQEMQTDHHLRLSKALAKNEHDSLAQVYTFIEFHLAIGSSADSEALACWLVVSGEALRHELIRIAFESGVTQFRNILQTIIENGKQRKIFKTKNPKEAATAIFAAIQGYFTLSATSPALIPRGSANRCVTKMALGILEIYPKEIHQ